MPDPAPPCPVCGGDHVVAPGGSCPVMRVAAVAGARPPGVPPAIYAGYLDAREALKHDAPADAARALRRLLALVAGQRGAPAGAGLDAQLQRLCDDGVISPRVRASLSARASESTPEGAWALMSIVEHALYRLYLRPAHS